MAKSFADTISDGLVAGQIRKAIEEGNRLQKEQLEVLKQIRDKLGEK